MSAHLSSIPNPGPRVEALTVFVRGLRIEAAIGVYDHEHGRTQPLVIDARLEIAPRPVEHLADTFNYETVVRLARGLADEGHIGLVETFAQRLAEGLMDDPDVLSVTVAVAKPEALAGADAAGCELTLRR